MQGLSINLNEVREHAVRVNQSNHSFLEELNNFSNVMQNLMQHWDSPSASELYGEFQRMRPMFDEYKEYIDRYYQFLNQTVDTYEKLDRTLEKGIGSI